MAVGGLEVRRLICGGRCGRLTAKGRKVVDEVTALQRSAIRTIRETMPRVEARRLVRALTAFAVAADEPTAALGAATLLGW